MTMKPKSKSPARKPHALHRRAALKGLGAIAVSLPTFASLSCSGDEDSPDGGPGQTIDPVNEAGAGGAQADAAVGQDAASASGPDAGSSTGNPASDAGGIKDSGAPATSGDAGATTDAGGAAGDAGVQADAGSAGLLPPNFENAPMCTLTPTDPAGEGPFFLHDSEVMTDASIVRSDAREGRPGVELQLNLRMLDSAGSCMNPIADMEVYIWHTDALGFYSGFNGQDPNKTYSGGIERTPDNNDRFCRGMQVTDAAGVVSFRTLYPGWYNGRPIHIHFLALKKGSGAMTTSYRSAQYHVFTTQMYFEEAFSRNIHEKNAPYNTRASGAGYDAYIKPSSSTVRPKARMEGNVAVASLNIITRADQSRR